MESLLLSNKTGIFPDDRKISKPVTLIDKDDSKTNLNNLWIN